MTKKPTCFQIFAIFAAVFLAGTSHTWAAPDQQLMDLSFIPESGHTTVVVEASSTPINFTYYTANDDTLVLEVIGASASLLPELTSVGTAELEEIRVSGFDKPSGNTKLHFKKANACPQKVYMRENRLYVEFSSCDETGDTREAFTSGDFELTPQAIEKPAIPVRNGRLDVKPDRASRPYSKALELQALSVQSREGALIVDITGDGYLEYHDFVLEEPDRLVIDFKDVVHSLPRRNLEIDSEGVLQIRSAQFQDYPERIARVVFDLEHAMDYEVVPRGSSLRVVFGAAGNSYKEYDPVASSRPAIDLLEGEPSDDAGEETGQPAFSGALLPYEAAPQASVGNVPVVGGLTDVTDYEARVIGDLPSEYQGELISLDFKDADVKDVLRFFSEISGLNIILDQEVQGTVTVRLTEVPWDQALDIILKNHGYGKDLKGNVLRIAPHGKLAQEEQAEREFKDEQELNVPLITITRPISYAKASSVKAILDQVISSRGSIIVDDRTNTLVIKEVDLPRQQRAITELINTLDQPTPQVEIEARIVETSKQFERSLGIQWGFSGIASAQTGTTTDLVFPNNFKLDGDLLSSDSGFRSELPNEGWAVNLPASGANAAIGLQFGNILDTVQLDLALSAAENEGFARTISAPKITTQNNQNASIESGFKIPIQTTANQTTTTQFVSASLQLDVTPQITADKTIIMDIDVSQDFPNFTLASLTGGNAPINSRRASTQVLVPDGATTVIGGIFQFSEDNSVARIPLFHKIPLLKYFFKNADRNRQNNELLIFITPRIKKLQR